jgi:hypothetical protein
MKMNETKHRRKSMNRVNIGRATVCHGSAAAVLASTALFATFLLTGLRQAEASGLVYDNGAPVGTNNAYYIHVDSGFMVSDAFTLSSSTTLDSAQAGLWVDTGATPITVDWSVGTVPFASDISSGTASLINTFLFYNIDYDFDVYESAFAISGSLGAGTYYFTLQNATTSDSGNVAWDISNGPSAAFHNTDGNISSESFQLYGEVVPEPTTVSLLALGGILFLLLRRQPWAASANSSE